MSVGVVLPLGAEQADLATAGGKGESLSILVRAGIPVPPGFHISTTAYRDFTAGPLTTLIHAALTTEPEDAASTIAAAFARAPFPASTAAAILSAYADLGSPAVAVRSSATAEDLPGLSFAGQQDSFLNITGEEALLDAVRRCWASLWTARAIGYRARHGITGDLALAVVVQELVPADSAGVLFTANPVTGAQDEVVINAAWGLGESVVGGQVTPDTYVITNDTVVTREVADKTVRTVRTARGTRDEPVPTDLRWLPVLTDDQARELAALGRRIHRLYHRPTDIEWAWHDGRFAILQARPITTVVRETWNDSQLGDYLWTSANLGEAIPSVMTPATWSLVRAVSVSSLGGHPMNGNIGGRFYLNISLSLGLADAVGAGRFLRRANENLWGRIGADLPRLPTSRLTLIRLALRMALGELGTARTLRRRLPELLATGQDRSRDLRERIAKTDDPAALARLWDTELDQVLRVDAHLLSAAARTVALDQSRVRTRLEKLLDPGEVTALLSGAHGAGGDLASLGPVLGLAELRAGRLDREAYAAAWGHRGPDEFEVSLPRPAETPAWIEAQLRTLGTGEQDPSTLLARQAQLRQAAWHRLQTRHPAHAAKLWPKLDRAARAARRREQARSEFARLFWIFRAFLVRAGELTGHGEDLFFLSIEETVRVLHGDPAPLAAIPARRAAYEHYRALPRYPTLLRGHFDPDTWAADPHRRTDRFDATATPAPAPDDLVRGFGGVAGVVEGLVRLVPTVERGAELQPGEILVTTVTNIGWTPLFPRAAAVVTDIGAPLSHAAIVARELGIPAVVGCGDATTRLRTGDRVRVDGGQGTVTVIDSAP
ncbi:PEP/pyruvate-binding domain-containing protein [Crossiella sp. CA198]|uniref:PEP/pyruvate-binding domain-containing protein n=1 Tax=Crossiella sp. CA198 TaxID=3455607 RepID=UPI003F8D0102